MMSESVLVALLALYGVIGAALISALGIIVGLVWRKLTKAEATNNSLWTYTRILIDAYYRDARAAPPAPPEYIAHLYGGGEV